MLGFTFSRLKKVVPPTSDLWKWLFLSRSGLGVGVTNYSGVGLGVGTGVGANNLSGEDSGMDLLLSVFFVTLFYTPTRHP
jgi:hypothetical protein